MEKTLLKYLQVAVGLLTLLVVMRMASGFSSLLFEVRQPTVTQHFGSGISDPTLWLLASDAGQTLIQALASVGALSIYALRHFFYGLAVKCFHIGKAILKMSLIWMGKV